MCVACVMLCTRGVLHLLLYYYSYYYCYCYYNNVTSEDIGAYTSYRWEQCRSQERSQCDQLQQLNDAIQLFTEEDKKRH